MLGPAFDAVFIGQDAPVRDTPLKKLPVHSAPPINRPRSTTHPILDDDTDSVRRSIMDDIWLYNVTTDVALGRVLKMKFVGSNKQHITTTKGTFIITRSMRVIRGKDSKMSIHGNVVALR